MICENFIIVQIDIWLILILLGQSIIRFVYIFSRLFFASYALVLILGKLLLNYTIKVYLLPALCCFSEVMKSQNPSRLF